MNRLSVILALAAAGCASVNPVPFTGPSGRQGYAMQCSGMGRSIEQCYQVGGAEVPRWLSDRQPVERDDSGSAQRKRHDGTEDGAGGGVQVVLRHLFAPPERRVYEKHFIA